MTPQCTHGVGDGISEGWTHLLYQSAQAQQWRLVAPNVDPIPRTFLSHPHDVDFSLEESEVCALSPKQPSNQIVHRSVDIPCPSGKHKRSLVTFRNHTVAAMFCLPCETAWTESTSHPELRNLAVDSAK